MRTQSATILSLLAGMCVTPLAGAADRHVPSVYPTIQAAIDAAVDGDQVVVADGVYTGRGNVNLTTLGKGIVVRSANGADNCIITGRDVLGDHAFIIDSNEPPTTSITGFTIEHFHTTHAEPGAVRVIGASPELKELIYRHNTTEQGEDGPTVSGSALYVEGTPINRFCQFLENEGAPVLLQSGTMYILNSEFDGNTARGSAAGAAENRAFMLIFFCELRNNTVTADTGVARGGAVAHFGTFLDLTDNSFENNAADGPEGALGAAVFLGGSSVININTFLNHAGNHAGGTIAVVSSGETMSATMSVTIESSSVGGLLVDQTAGPVDVNLHSGDFCNNSPYDIDGVVEFFGLPSFCTPGDLNGDGTVDQQDRSLFCASLGSSSGESAFIPGADMNDDSTIDTVDQLLFNDLLPPCNGDVVSSATFQPPADGVTDAADLAFLLGAWASAPSCADFVTSRSFAPPPDGTVDAADLAFLLGAWGACN